MTDIIFNQAIENLISLGFVETYDEDGQEMYRITDLGLAYVEKLKSTEH